MVLAIDVGNTNIVLGGFEDEEILFRERISTNHTATVLEYASMIKTALEMYDISPKSVTGAIISSVRNVEIPNIYPLFLKVFKSFNT